MFPVFYNYRSDVIDANSRLGLLLLLLLLLHLTSCELRAASASAVVLFAIHSSDKSSLNCDISL